MLDLDKIAGFEWDEANSRKNEGKHSVSRLEAEQVFVDEGLKIAEDMKHNHTEPRFHALGQTNDGRLLHITFTVRKQDTLIRVISARPMSRKERAQYGKKA